MDAVFLGQRSPKTEEKHDCMAVQKKGVVWDKRPEKKKKAMENFHRFAGASCLTRTGDTLINSQVL